MKEKNDQSERKNSERIDENILNQFKEKKFENDKFNLIFDYNLLKNKKQEKASENRQLIHYTTDGFYGYNSSDLQNYAIVKSFNGLLISDDLIEEYDDDVKYGKDYSDFRDIYKNHVKNPKKMINITKDEEARIKKLLKKEAEKAKKASDYLFEDNDIDENEVKDKNNYEKEQYKLYKKNLKNLEKQQEKDKKIIINSGIYDKDLIEDAENQVLDMSPSLLRALDEHYKFKRLNN
jgi:glutamate synthase domain-containing protein 2